MRIGTQELPDHLELVSPVLVQYRRAPVLQEERPGRDAVHVEEVLEHVVDVPRAARHVEDRVEGVAIGAELQGPVEGSHPLERQPRAGVVAQHDPGHLQHVRRARVHHRVVDVADDAEPGPLRHEHLTRRPDSPPARRRRREQIQLDPVPAGRAVQGLRKAKMDLEEALGVGDGLHL